MKLKKEFQPQEFVSSTKVLDFVAGENGKPSTAKVVLMSSGWNLNDVYVPKEIINEITKLAPQKPKLFINHDPYAWLGRNMNEWAGTITSCEYKEEDEVGQAIAEIVFTDNPNTAWLKGEVKRDASQVQLSTHLRGYQKEGEFEGRKGFAFSTLTEYKSTDFVPYGAAGGYALESLNSIQGLVSKEKYLELISKLDNNLNNQQQGEEEMEIKNIAELRAAFPDLLNAVIKEEMDKTKTSIELTEKAAQVDTLNSQVSSLNTKVTDTEKKLTEAQELLNTVTKERDALKAKVDESETAIKIAAWKAEVETAIVNSKIDEKAVTPLFKETLFSKTTIEEVNSLIEDRKIAVGAASVVAPVIQVGGTVVVKPKDSTSSVKTLTDEELARQLRG